MVTEYGKILRKIRIDNCEVLGEMADKLEISSAYLSSIETGVRKVPENLTTLISNKYNLSSVITKQLEEFEIENMKEVKTVFNDSTSKVKKETALIFARTFNNINEDNMEKIKAILVKQEDK